jgi:hypothetical protein
LLNQRELIANAVEEALRCFEVLEGGGHEW